MPYYYLIGLEVIPFYKTFPSLFIGQSLDYALVVVSAGVFIPIKILSITKKFEKNTALIIKGEGYAED